MADHRAEEIKLLARDHAELAIETLAEVAGDPTAKEAARVKAADVLLQRGFGAPERRVEQTLDVTIYDQRQAHLNALQKLAERKKLAGPKPKPDNDDDIVDAEFEVIENKPKQK